MGRVRGLAAAKWIRLPGRHGWLERTEEAVKTSELGLTD